MLDNIWGILVKAGVPMKSFTLNPGLEQYNWMLSDVDEGTLEEEVAWEPQIPRPRMQVN